MKSPFRFALALLALAAIAPVHAQDTIGTLTVNQGTVMTSTGGEFASAATGEGIQAGERIMVSEGGSATVTYSNGVVVNYTAPGVYTAQLPAAGANLASAGGASTAATVGIIAGVAALGAAAVESNGDNVAPESPVSR